MSSWRDNMLITIISSHQEMHIKSTNISISSANNKWQPRTPSLTNNNSSKSNTEALCCVEILLCCLFAGQIISLNHFSVAHSRPTSCLLGCAIHSTFARISNYLCCERYDCHVSNIAHKCRVLARTCVFIVLPTLKQTVTVWLQSLTFIVNLWINI